MSDVSKTNELINRLRSMAADIDELLDDPESLLDVDDVAVIITEAADALATRVPVQGEPNDDREALLWNIEDRLKLLEAGAREPLARQMTWTEDSTAEVLAIVGALAALGSEGKPAGHRAKAMLGNPYRRREETE